MSAQAATPGKRRSPDEPARPLSVAWPGGDEPAGALCGAVTGRFVAAGDAIGPGISEASKLRKKSRPVSSDPARPLEAVLFDMDGTLLDSEKIWDAALEDLATHLGGVVSVQARQSMVGSSLWRSVSLLHEDLGISADLIESADYLMARTGALFRTHLAWKPGALELLGAVSAAGIAAALVTSTYRELTEVALDFIGREFFLATVCGDEVTRPKPAPDPYLRAAEFLDVDAMNCVAIEDSPLGIASAESAGCAVLVVPSEVAIEPAPTRTIVSSLRVVDLDLLRALL